MHKLQKDESRESASSWRSLNIQLFALIVIPLTILLLSIAFGSVLLHQSAMRALVAERDQRAAQAAASALAEQLDHRLSSINALASRAADGLDLQLILNSSSFFLQDFDAGLAFVDQEGSLLAFEGNSDFWGDLPDTAKFALNEIMMEAQYSTFFSGPFFHPDYETTFVFVGASIPNNSLFAIGAFSPSELAIRSIGDAFPVDEVASAIYVGPNYRLIFQQGQLTLSDDPSVLQSLTDISTNASGASFYQSNGEELVVAYSSIPATEWVFVTEESWTSLASPLLRSTELAPLVLVPVVILAVIAIWFGARQIIAPLQALENKATALAWGDFEAVKEEVGGIAEIGRLQKALILMAGKVRNAQQSLRGYIGAITKGQEDERQRIARDLHDETIQSLIALNQKVQLAQIASPESASNPALSEINQMIEQNIKDVRQIIRDLRPPYLEALGLSAALEMLVEETGKTSSLDIDFVKKGRERRLGPEIELTLYRIAQEGISNVLRHSKADKAVVRLEFSEEKVRMNIDDNGLGFYIPEAPTEFAPVGHFGLLGIYERAELINAKLNIQSKLGDGTSIEISIYNR